MEIFRIPLDETKIITIAARLTTEADAWECGLYRDVELPRSAQWRRTQPNERDKVYKARFPGAQIYAYAGAVNNADAAAHRLATRPNYVYADNIAENFHNVFLNANLSKGLVGPRRKPKRAPRVYDDFVMFHDFTLNDARVVVAFEDVGFGIRFGGARDFGGVTVVSIEALKHTAWSRLQIRPIVVGGTLENARDVEWFKNVVQSVGMRGYRHTRRREALRDLPNLELAPKPHKTLPELNEQDVHFKWIVEKNGRATCVAYIQEYSDTLGFFVSYGAATLQRSGKNNPVLGQTIALGRLKVRPVCIGDHRGAHASSETWLTRIRRFGRRGAERFNRGVPINC